MQRSISLSAVSSASKACRSLLNSELRRISLIDIVTAPCIQQCRKKTDPSQLQGKTTLRLAASASRSSLYAMDISSYGVLLRRVYMKFIEGSEGLPEDDGAARDFLGAVSRSFASLHLHGFSVLALEPHVEHFYRCATAPLWRLLEDEFVSPARRTQLVMHSGAGERSGFEKADP